MDFRSPVRTMDRNASLPASRTKAETAHELLRRLNHRWWREFERAERLQRELNTLRQSPTFRWAAWLRGRFRGGRPSQPESVPPPGPARGEPIPLTAPPGAGAVSIIVPFRDRIELLHHCLGSLRTTSYRPRDLVLVDGGSS